MMATNRAGLDLGFAREAAEAVADALVAGLERGDREVIRGGQMRLAMITANRERPAEVDERFRGPKARLEEAVTDHRVL
jgi:uncharacterized oxidoreductase